MNASKQILDLSDAHILAVRNVCTGDIREAILVLFQNQVEDERVQDVAKLRNRVGFSSGTVHFGSALAKKVLAGETWTEWEELKARKIVGIHARQLKRAGYVEAA